MKQTMWKLENTIKNYAWGSLDSMSLLFGIKNPDQQPMAEMWMGAHPLGCSVAVTADNHKVRLDELITTNPLATLGKSTLEHYHGLPFLFKVLAANKALSIQVHPTKAKAKLGFDRENKLGIDLNSPQRNYKDPNHKPELIYALTPFKAMNSFRPIDEIIALFDQVTTTTISNEIQQLQQNRNPDQLKSFFQTLLSLSSEQKQQAINQLLTSIQSRTDEPYLTVQTLAQEYPDDIGIFMPLILNVIELHPGEAMFLYAETPHAYIQGTGLEVMANSDNVLRAGLTSKHIDIPEVIKNTHFNSVPLKQLTTKPIINQNKTDFPIPVADFTFEIIQSDNQTRSESVTSPQILFCIKGKITIKTQTQSLTLTTGESAFIAYDTENYSYSGTGVLAKAAN
ncbi:mannose-6-phosphate isomerase, class I [Gilliamella sp. wkB178]|uniref:mannose-6-phosphate isomerase, class I n=1 Tax=Gilliamella sp. wkB178 TaxID=3120259 RepID=UPI00080EB2D8|nr:mannose-6-phosphate isomerase, class I [Gilliamella apicola]OCG07893.1 mannose-6-phosphate isomerase, class I [Gilliamella apicola]